MQNLDLDDIIFAGSVLKKLLEVLQNANQNLVEVEMENFLTRVAATEMLLEQKGVTEAEIKSFIFENQDEVKQHANSLALTLTVDIVSKNE